MRPRRNDPFAGKRSAKRKAGTREQRQNFLIVTGGERTEHDYFSWIQSRLRGANLSVRVHSEGVDPITLVEIACELKKENAREAKKSKDTSDQYDAVWAVTDVDEFAGQIHEARGKAARAGVDLVISNPCFEVWLVYHQDSSPKHVNRFEAQARAKRFGVVEAENKKKVVFAKIEGCREKASATAENHRKYHAGNRSYFPDDAPSTSVDILVQDLLDSARRANPDLQDPL